VRASSSTRTSSPVRSASATLKDVADLAGVSLATASRVLNGSERVVGEALREKVLAVADQVGYVSNGPAQALARAATDIVGLVIHDVDDPYFSAIASGAMAVARANGLLLLVTSTSRDPELEVEYINRLRAQRARAIVLAGSGFADRDQSGRVARAVDSYLGTGGRVVGIGRHGMSGDTVAPAHRAGAKEAARHLRALGHRSVGIACGPLGLTTVRERLTGFSSEMARLGAPIPDDAIEEGGFSREGGAAAAAALLERRPQLTAIFAANDLMATGAISYLRESGRHVPDDVSIVGYDDIELARDITPTLTTVRLPLREIGERAMDLVLGSPGPPRTVRVPAELIERDSTARPPSARKSAARAPRRAKRRR
jgi:LacI family transcriptional regulator